jgi:hypothetical protein
VVEKKKNKEEPSRSVRFWHPHGKKKKKHGTGDFTPKEKSLQDRIN